MLRTGYEETYQDFEDGGAFRDPETSEASEAKRSLGAAALLYPTLEEGATIFTAAVEPMGQE